MLNLVNYLKEPILVAQIQDRFGIKDTDEGSKNGKIERLASTVRKCDPERVKKNGENHSPEKNGFVVRNKFWYYLFLIGTNLGDEVFYSTFIPFWILNIDCSVGRRIIFVWTIVMYIGQSLKNMIQWPRPSHPAKRLQKKWADEYGMPSTHAMVAVSIPFSVIIFTVNKYIYSVGLGVLVAVLWCVVVSVSRIYFGMHTVLDIIAGLILSSALLLPIIPVVDMLDHFWLNSALSPLILLLVSVASIYFFPSTKQWTPTKNDTTMIASVCVGIHVGAWTNLKLGYAVPLPYLPPYAILWPNGYLLGVCLLRTIVGIILNLLSRLMTKSLGAEFLSFLLHTTPQSIRKKSGSKETKEIFAELAITYCTYFVIGFNIVHTMPILFKLLGIERQAFYSET